MPYRPSRVIARPQAPAKIKVKPRIPNILFDHSRIPRGYARLPGASSKSMPAAAQTQPAQSQYPPEPNLSTFQTAQQWRQLTEWLGSVGKKIKSLAFVALRDGWTRHELYKKVNLNPGRSRACVGYLVVCRSINDEVFGGYQGTPQLFMSSHKHRSQ